MNILVVGPHPDDQEAGMGAAIAKLVAQGHHVLLLDMTDGEPTPLGSPEIRAKESAAAAAILGVKRLQLGLTNRRIEHTLEARHKVAAVIRAHQAQVVFTPFFEDAHPDHIATTRIVEDARFDAKLTKMEFPLVPGLAEVSASGSDGRGQQHRIYPKWLFYYYATHLRWVANPSFLIDVSGYEVKKVEAMEAYHSQFVAPGKIGAQPAGRTARDWALNSMAYFGTRIGTMFAEPFYTKEPVGLVGLEGLV
jgi:bacillithiol biosynthesis deacetylase BshB1